MDSIVASAYEKTRNKMGTKWEEIFLPGQAGDYAITGRVNFDLQIAMRQEGDYTLYEF